MFVYFDISQNVGTIGFLGLFWFLTHDIKEANKLEVRAATVAAVLLC